MDKKLVERVEKLSRESTIILEYLTVEINKRIDNKMQSYRQSMVVRDKWCCMNMQEFAAKFWHVTSPVEKSDGFGSSYHYNGKPVIYCPFCGVKL